MNHKLFRAGAGLGASANLVAAGPSVLLADVSEFQAGISDALYLAWSKAIAIRALYGAQHVDGAWYGGQRRALLHAGGARVVLIYQYLVASQPGAAQAQAFHQLVGAIRPGEIFVADFEEGAKTVLTDWYNEMLRLYGQGIAPHLWTYTGENFGAAEGVLPVEWIAAYQATEPASPHKLWQFTDSYNVPGVGRADCSVFHGTIAELAALAYQEPAKPPADWTYGPVQHLRVTPGHHDFRATWSAPAGAPEPPDHYLIYVYKGRTCDVQTLVPTYPRVEHGTVTSPDPGGLEPDTEYTLHVVAVGAGGTHVKPFEFATAAFTTGR
jgi:hypothetical protein